MCSGLSRRWQSTTVIPVVVVLLITTQLRTSRSGKPIYRITVAGYKSLRKERTAAPGETRYRRVVTDSRFTGCFSEFGTVLEILTHDRMRRGTEPLYPRDCDASLHGLVADTALVSRVRGGRNFTRRGDTNLRAPRRAVAVLFTRLLLAVAGWSAMYAIQLGCFTSRQGVSRSAASHTSESPASPNTICFRTPCASRTSSARSRGANTCPAGSTRTSSSE